MRRGFALSGLAVMVVGACATHAKTPELGGDTMDRAQRTALAGDEMQRLQPMVGDWDCEETYHAGGFVEATARATGRDLIRIGPGGHSLVAEYASDGDIGEYRAHDIITWSADESAYRMLFVDSFAPGVQDQRGEIDGNTVTFSHRTDLGFGPGVFRRTYTLAPDRQDLVVDFTPDGGVPKALVTIVKTRR